MYDKDTCHCAHMDFRRQLTGVGSFFFHHVGIGAWTQVLRIEFRSWGLLQGGPWPAGPRFHFLYRENSNACGFCLNEDDVILELSAL